MKNAVLCSIFALVFLSTEAIAQPMCNQGSGPNGGAPGYPPFPTDPYRAGPGFYQPNQTQPGYPPISQITPAGYSAAAQSTSVSPSGPTARVTVVSANPVLTAQPKTSAPTAILTLVDEATLLAHNEQESTAVDAIVPATEPPQPAIPETVDPAIAGLVGTWRAVARHGDGKLTTVELQLDNRGWAELTVPGNDGQPSTTKSRVNLENEELKLKDSDRVVTLGKLITFNTRQMVIERADGQLTFVRL